MFYERALLCLQEVPTGSVGTFLLPAYLPFAPMIGFDTHIFAYLASQSAIKGQSIYFPGKHIQEEVTFSPSSAQIR